MAATRRFATAGLSEPVTTPPPAVPTGPAHPTSATAKLIRTIRCRAARRPLGATSEKSSCRHPSSMLWPCSSVQSRNCPLGQVLGARTPNFSRPE